MTRLRRPSRGTRKGGTKKRRLRTRAEQAIERHETMVLSERDAEAFLDAILDPPKPNARLRKSLDEHRRRVITKAGGTQATDPFATFSEWNSPEDKKAFRDL